MKKISLFAWSFLILSISCSHNQQKPTENASHDNKIPASQKKNIVFFGNSLTAGYGLEDLSQGFVSLTQNRLDSLHLNYNCINAGLSGETTAGGKERISWIASQQSIDIFILELGGNDALRGIMPNVSIQNLQSIIDVVKAKNKDVKIILAGMQAPPQMGKDYTGAFKAMYPTLAEKNKIGLIPFILEGVGGIPQLNQKDGIHPTPEGNKIVAQTIWNYLQKEIIQ